MGLCSGVVRMFSNLESKDKFSCNCVHGNLPTMSPSPKKPVLQYLHLKLQGKSSNPIGALIKLNYSMDPHVQWQCALMPHFHIKDSKSIIRATCHTPFKYTEEECLHAV